MIHPYSIGGRAHPTYWRRPPSSSAPTCPLSPTNTLLLLLGCCSCLLTLTAAHSCNVVVYFGQKTAECTSQGLTDVPPGLGYDIKVLQFKGNAMTQIGIDYFKQYTALQELFIEKNRISSIAPEGFRGLSNLQVLDLNGNQLTTVPIATFAYMTSLRELILKANPIRYITENAFGNLPHIEILNFENCFLERVDPKAFHGLTHVKEINIVNNELQLLEAEMEQSLPPNLSIFRLYRNPWKCDCKLRWLREWIENTKVNWDFSQNTPACSSPEIMRGLNWEHLNPEQFACPSQILANGTTSMELEVGENVTVECLINGDPLPSVTWFKGSQPITMTTDINKYMLVIIGQDPIRSSLTIWDVRMGDAGDYKCVAANSAGRSEVTYKLWIRESMDVPQPEGVTGISQESILGIAVGGALFILILVVCVVYGLRRRDRRKHAYRVRDYKKPTKGKKDKSYIKENCDKSLPGATTELLSEKEKEKEKERGKMELQMTENAMSNDIRHDNEEFKMKIFSYSRPGKEDVKGQLDHGYATPDREDTETDPLCKNTDTLKPACNDVREVTPDLLKNDSNSGKHHAKKANHVTTKEENPYVKEYKPNGGIDRQKDLQLNKDYSANSNSSRDRHGRDSDHHNGVRDRGRDHEPSTDRHRPPSRKGSLEDILAQNSSSSKDSLCSTQRGSSRGSPCRSPNLEHKDNLVNQSQSSSSPHGVPNNQPLSSSLSKNPEHRRERLSEGVKFATLPSKSGASKGLPASAYMQTGTMRPASRQQGRGGPGKPNQRPHSQGWNPHGLPGSPQGSPARPHTGRTGAGGAPVPIIKLPDGHLVGKKDYRTLVVPPPPLPPANRSPFAIKATPSGPAALVNPGEGMPPAPRKPPRTYSSVYENPYSTVSRQSSRQSSQSSRQNSHDSDSERPHKLGEKDEFGTCV